MDRWKKEGIDREKGMKVNEILRHVDHTLLLQTAVWEEIRQICDEAVSYRTA